MKPQRGVYDNLSEMPLVGQGEVKRHKSINQFVYDLCPAYILLKLMLRRREVQGGQVLSMVIISKPSFMTYARHIFC